MKNYQRCPSCKGSRKILGMGFIEDDCKTCDGQGWLKLEEDNAKNSQDYAEQDIFQDSKNGNGKTALDKSKTARRKTNRA